MKLYIFVKRMLDFLLAIILLVLVSPTMFGAVIAIKLDSPGPAFFKQKRLGKDSKLFSLFKFRTMQLETEKDCRRLSDMERMTKVGSFLRKTSVDELPQLFNILRGEMSFIGPRPLLTQYLDYYTPEQMRRHDVTPGISGWAQVNGRNAISWQERFELDVWYVDHISFWLDMKIFFMTIRSVLNREGINNSANDTMPFFSGASQKYERSYRYHNLIRGRVLNILFVSAGRRVELVQEFVRVKKKKGITGSIVCTDMSDLAPALYFADKTYTIPAIRDPQFLSALMDICRKESINLIIPTIDTELEVLSHNVGRFKEIGADVLVSSPETVKITRNKLKTYWFFKSIDIKTPESYGMGMDYSGSFPCFIKPISGSSSINAFKVRNEKELEFFKYYIGDYIVQKLIEGQEYTIDVMCDFEGNPIFVTPRIRLATRSGEVNKTRIVSDEKLIKQTLFIIEKLKPKGPITVQAIKNKVDGEYYFIEINARFGGGSPLSIMAGADSAGAVYDLLEGKRLELNLGAAKPGLVFLRFDQSIVLKQKIDGHYEKV